MRFRTELLGDHIALRKGLSYKGEYLVEESSLGLVGLDAFVAGGGYKPGAEKPYSGAFKPDHLAESGDVLLAMTEQQDGLLASPLVVPENLGGYEELVLSHHVAKVVAKSGRLRPEFVFNFLRVPINRTRAAYGNTGTTVQDLPYDVIYEQMIPVPSIEEQDRINSFIAVLDRKIELNTAMATTLEKIAQTIFKSWFVDFDPVKAKMAGEKPVGMDDATAALFPDSMEETELGLIPRNWTSARLDDELLLLESGKRPRGGAAGESGVPSIGAESIRGLGAFDFSNTKFIPIDFYDSMPTGRVNEFDVLVYKDGAGAGSYVSMFGCGFPFEKFAINEHVFLLRAKSVSQYFLYFWMAQNKIKNLMIELAQKSAQPGLNQKDMRTIGFLRPETSVVEKFSEIVEPIIMEVMKLANQSRQLSTIRDTLLPRLISGELQLPEEMLAP